MKSSLRDELADVRGWLREARASEHQQHLKLKDAGNRIERLINVCEELVIALRTAVEVLEENDLLDDPRISGL